MKDNKNIPEPEVFTNKIEETIDDLFKPTKNIEIDPLTQEVKEIDAEKSVEEQPEIELELAIEEPTQEGSPQEDVKEVKENDKAYTKENEPKPEPELEPEIELELIEEEGTEDISLEVEEAKEKEDDISLRLGRLREDIYTIEWEVSGQELSETLKELRAIVDLPEIKANRDIAFLLSLSARVLEMGVNAPEKMEATAPHTLKRAIETAITIHQGKMASQDELEEIKTGLEELLEKEAVVTSDTQAKPQRGKKEEPKPHIPQTTEKKVVQSSSKAHDKEAEKVILAHIHQLQRQVNRIVPLERLLSNTPGMEKLYKFHRSIRSNLEKEINVLAQYFFPGIDLELPKADASEEKKADYVSEIKGQGCPWKQLLTISLEGMEIGIPAEQVVYASQPPFFSKSFIKKADTLPLAKLKPWPWSRLSGLFGGTLSEMNEKELGSLELPIIKKLDDSELPVPSNFFVIVIYDGEKGAVLRTQESPISINVPENARCQMSDSGSFAGQVEVNGNKIRVLTADSVAR